MREPGQPTRSSGMPHPYTERRLESGSLGAIVGNYKSVAARRINRTRNSPGAPVWQSNFHERIIRNERELDAIRQYIRNNPVNWDDDSENPDSMTR
jgi:putative transposase